MASSAPSRFHEAAESAARVFAWGARAIYLGPALNLSAHRNAVAVVALGLDHAFGVADPPAGSSGWYRRCRSAVIPPGTLHHFAVTCGRMAFLYVDPFSDDLFRLRASAATPMPHAAFDLAQQDPLIRIMTALADRRADWPATRAALEPLLAGPARRPIDSRVKSALAILHRDAQERTTLETLAAHVGLSESRLRHLFKDATGVPLRRYRLWVAMRAALQTMARGESLTQAAMDGGFASSAHFSSAFRDMFGMEPSRLARGRMAMGG
ncbi:AraC-like DNA-binding protein [Sphingomonas sp. UYAg733]